MGEKGREEKGHGIALIPQYQPVAFKRASELSFLCRLSGRKGRRVAGDRAVNVLAALPGELNPI